MILANTATKGFQTQVVLTMDEVQIPPTDGGAAGLSLAMALALVLLEMF